MTQRSSLKNRTSSDRTYVGPEPDSTDSYFVRYLPVSTYAGTLGHSSLDDDHSVIWTVDRSRIAQEAGPCHFFSWVGAAVTGKTFAV